MTRRILFIVLSLALLFTLLWTWPGSKVAWGVEQGVGSGSNSTLWTPAPDIFVECETDYNTGYARCRKIEETNGEPSCGKSGCHPTLQERKVRIKKFQDRIWAAKLEIIRLEREFGRLFIGGIQVFDRGRVVRNRIRVCLGCNMEGGQKMTRRILFSEKKQKYNDRHLEQFRSRIRELRERIEKWEAEIKRLRGE